MMDSQMLQLGVLALGCLVALTLTRALIAGFRSPLASIPGPYYSRFTNLVLKYHVLRGRRMYYIDALHARYGPVVRIAPGEVAVADLDAFAQIHGAASGPFFAKSAFYDNMTTDIGGSGGPGGTYVPGIFAMRDRRAHAARRRLFARSWAKSALRRHWEPTVRDEVAHCVRRIREEASSGTADVFKWFTFMAADVMSHLSFGESLGMLALGRTTPYITAMQESMVSIGLGAELPWLYAALRRLPIARVRAVVRAGEVMFEHSARAVRILRERGGAANLFGQVLAKADAAPSSPDGGGVGGDEEGGISELTMRVEVANLMVAGTDTTAVTLTYLTWAVLRRPALQRRLEAEVARLDLDRDGGLGDAELEARLPLLNSVIAETLRLYGAAPGSLPRVVPDGGATLGGHFVPAGTVASTQAYTMHRDAELFPNPLEFDPERFLEPPTAKQKMAFHPFGAGSRICLGMHLAYMELRLAAALFFRECAGARLSDDMDDSVMEMENAFLISPKGHRCNITLRAPASP
ncbi:cytochrome P450 [Xylariaceae sp. FL0804]|nr:cytochrome P450 [Xylariaceae sp. FL0804]